MNIPNLEIEKAGLWSSPETVTLSRPRFVLRYELECYMGEEGESWIDGTSYPLRPHTFLFARPGQIRFSRFPFQARFLYFDAVDPSPEFEAWLSSLPSYLAPSDTTANTMEELIQKWDADTYTERLEAQILLLQCLIALSKSGVPTQIKKPRPKQEEVFHMIRYMKQHVYTSLSVADLAAEAGYSVPHFNTFFRSLVGRTPYEYYMSLKLLEARRLLLSDQCNSTEAAHRLGFSSVSHFCAAFRRAFGQSPKAMVDEFRRENALPDEIVAPD